MNHKYLLQYMQIYAALGKKSFPYIVGYFSKASKIIFGLFKDKVKYLASF